MNDHRREDELTLEMLEAIEERSDVTQRNLAKQMGVALGLANSYLRRCVRKGLVKIHQAPSNRYLYYLTPGGFAEKSRLTSEYLVSSFGFYRQASSSCAESVAQLQAAGAIRIGIYGASDLAEIAITQTFGANLEIACVCDASKPPGKFLGCPLVSDPHDAEDVHAWLLTALLDPARALKDLQAGCGNVEIAVPDILGLRGHIRSEVN